jgi:hypothetical protein
MELRSIWTMEFPGWIGLAPVLSHGRMYVRAAGQLVCLDPAAGAEHWRTTVDPENDTGRVLAVCGETIVTSRHVNRTTRLVGVGLDGRVRWEAQTDTVIVDAYGAVGDRFIAFGTGAGRSLMHVVNPSSGAVTSVVPVRWRPDRFFAGDGRLYCVRRLPPGLFSVRGDGPTDERAELTDPVFSMSHEPSRLLLTVQHDDGYSVELRDAGLRTVWTRPAGSPLAAVRGDAVAVFDVDEAGRTTPALLRAGDGTLVCRGSVLADDPQTVGVLDQVVAVGTLTDLVLLSRDDLKEVAVYSLASYAVQAGPVLVITRTDRIEGIEVRHG